MARVFLIAGSFHPVLIKFGIETDDEAVFDTIGRGTQIAARSHRMLQNSLLVVGRGDKMQYLFALGNADFVGRLQ